MNELESIKENIKRMAGRNSDGAMILTVQVKSVGAYDCTVIFGDMELTAVRLFSQASKAGNLIVKPKVGSMATVITYPEMRDIQLIEADEIEAIIFKENGLVIEFDSITGKVDIKNNQVSLTKLFQQVSDMIKSIKVSVLAPNSISGPVDPGTMTSALMFETSFKQLLK